MMAETYNVVLLVEQALTQQDAAQVRSLHEGLEEPVTYHVLLPMEDAAARIEASMGSLAAAASTSSATPTVACGSGSTAPSAAASAPISAPSAVAVAARVA